MADHTTALVTIETWCFNSPELATAKHQVDLGLLGEALLYYDRILLHVTTQPQFAELLRWVQSTGDFDRFLGLVRDGVITMYDYSFHTAPFLKDGIWGLINVQDAVQATYGTFPRRFLYHKEVERVIPSSRRRKALYAAFRDRVIEAKADDFGPAIANARADYENPRRNQIVIQALVDEVYRFRELGRPPEVTVTMEPTADGLGQVLTCNIDFEKLNEIAGKGLGVNVGSSLAAAGVSNRLLWSAAVRGCDLFVGSPMAHLIGDKLFETVGTPAKTNETIVALKENVEFPDVRRLVNENKLSLGEVLALRGHSSRFRTWLQTEADRDRNALIAYHNEIAKEAGFVHVGRRALNLFGVVGGGAAGGAVGALVAGPGGAALGGAAGGAMTYFTDLGSKLGADWRPVVFGNWLRDRIVKYVSEK